MNEILISDMASLGAALREVAKKTGLSPSALVGNNGSLVSVATGARAPQDVAIGPILRVLSRASWELVLRPTSGHGLAVTREGALPLMIVGANGEPIEVPIGKMADLPQALMTMAAANDKTVSRMIKDAGSNSTSLVGVATGNGTSKDVRLLPFLRVAGCAEFRMYARPTHRTKRDARLRYEATRLLAAK